MNGLLQESTFIKICKGIEPQSEDIIPNKSAFRYATFPPAAVSELEQRVLGLFRPICRRHLQNELISILNEMRISPHRYILPQLAALLSTFGENAVTCLALFINFDGEWRGTTATVYTIRNYPKLGNILELDVDVIARGLSGKYGLGSETSILLR
jgi:hypothetical protein